MTSKSMMERFRGTRGSVMPIALVIVAGVGSAMTIFLGRTVSEQNRTRREADVERAAWRAIGQVELAKNVIQNSTYTDGVNDVLAAAVIANPPLIPGTPVVLEPAGTTRWYRLTSLADFGSGSSMAQCLVRDGLSYVAYNYYVENQNLGVSGKPKGRIHTNKTLEFYFAGGYYDGFVSAGTGFAHKNGATEPNTKLMGGSDQAAEPKSLLEHIDYADLKSSAVFTAPAGLVGEVKLNKTKIQVKLFQKDTTIQVPVDKTRQVQTGTELKLVTKTKYKTEWQWVNVAKTRKVWVDTSANVGTGTDLGGGGSTGYWKTENYTELTWKQVSVADGTYQVLELVPVYVTEHYTAYVTQTVAGKLVSTTNVDATGVIYIPDTIRAISGDLDGKVTLVTESNAFVTGNLRYVDADNDTAYLNGTTPSAGDYLPNPKFTRNHALGIIAQGDVRYALSAPSDLEINANLIATHGMVAMEGIVLDGNGTPSRTGTQKIKGSLRRFGSVMSYNRPVATLIDAAGVVTHGFSSGASVYDRSALNDPPPGFPNEESMNFLETVRIDPYGYTPPGTEVPDAGVTALAGLNNFQEIKQLKGNVTYDWGLESGDWSAPWTLVNGLLTKTTQAAASITKGGKHRSNKGKGKSF